MKTLVLSPYNYTDVRGDLVLFNFKQNIYSNFFAFEGMFARLARKKTMLSQQTSTILYLAEKMTQKEYDSFDIFFGPAPKKYHFDRVIVYNYDIVSSQEAVIAQHVPKFKSNFYTTSDATERCANIMEAIKLAQPTTTTGDR